MVVDNKISKILIFGGTGYLGKHLVRASIKLGHPTYVYSRPDSNKTDILDEFRSMGVTIIKGMINDHEKLVMAVRNVDVVISTLPYPQVFDQLKIVEAIKLAGNIKRFLPSDFGVEEDRVSVLPPFEAFLEKKRQIRRAIEEARIPYTFISANCYAAYFINYLLRPSEEKDEITVYGSGEAKTVMNSEEDIGIYTIKVATDPRTCNRIVIFRPPTNVVSQRDLISLWEKKTGKTFKKIHIPEEEIVALSQTLPDPDNIPVSIIHSVFIKGVTANFDLKGDDVEASSLYPDLRFSTVDELLDVFRFNPPEPAAAAFE
uniref:Eugenol synthase 5 n=1 Tax=Ocimum basilicum TaxID=39350 RepID=A0A894K123_OCIBA|nr:eugenol synthase 5 [Ocimum basilicum]